MKLCFPERILEQHVAVLGKTGAGKSSALRHVVEHLLAQGKRVCVIDPKGDWWGLKSAADGKSAGFPVIAFGDFKEAAAQDVPINQHSGKHIAELITSGNRPCIIGFRGWMTGHMIRFWIDFASTIFNANSGELYLVGDEFHNFAPKGKIHDPESGKCLHWSNRLMSEGRGYGLVCLIASQRPQKVHNDTLTCCETLCAMRLIHAADRDAVKNWIDGCGDAAQGREVLESLAGMARGEAFVWSPEIAFGPRRLKFPMFETFDSFAPPQLQKKVSAAGWAGVNLDEVKTKLATVIEEAKANDPRELKIQNAKLQMEIERLEKASAARVEFKEINVPSEEEMRFVRTIETLCVDTQAAINGWAEQMGTAAERLNKIIQDNERVKPVFNSNGKPVGTVVFEPISKEDQIAIIASMHGRMPISLPSTRAQHANNAKAQRREGAEQDTLGKCERSILTALAQYPQGRTAVQAAILAGYSVNSGGFNAALSKLRNGGLIERGNPMVITADGLGALGDYEPLPRGRALAEHWLNQLGKCDRDILSTLLSVYPAGLTSEEVAGETKYSANSGGFNAALSKLRKLELITTGQPMRASNDFFQ